MQYVRRAGINYEFLNQFMYFHLINIEYFIFLPPYIIDPSIRILPSIMSSKMKGIYKSFKYITQIFVVKDREMEIGYPTDVKHVAHIGLDSTSPSGSAPSWMNDFKTDDMSERRDSSSTAITALTHWSTHSQEFDLSIGYQSASDMSMELQQPQLPKKPKKKKGCKNTSSSSRTTKSKGTCNNSVEQIPNYQL